MSPRETFARLVIDYLKGQGIDGSIHYDPKGFRLVVPTRLPLFRFVNLGPFFTEYSSVQKHEQRRVMQKWLWSVPDTGRVPPLEEVLVNVVPRLRDRVYFSVQEKQLQAQLDDDAEIAGQTIPHQVLTEALGVELVFDLPTSTSEIPAHRLTAWKMDFATLLARALANLKDRTPVALEQLGPGLFSSQYGDGHDPSRMLVPEVLAALAPRLKGAPVVMVPSLVTLLVCGQDDAEALGMMADIGREAMADQRSLCGHAMVRDADGAWKPWLPPEGHPAFDRLFFLSLQTRANAYAQQKDLLDAWHELSQEDVNVARFAAYRSDEGVVYTATTWQQGSRVMLPRVDRIDFLKPVGDGAEAQVFPVRWDVAVSLLGERMVPVEGEVPPRWEVSDFPDDALLEKMAAESERPLD